MSWDQLIERMATAHLPWEVPANVFLQSTLVLGAGLLAGRLSKSCGAAVQSLVYRATLVAVLVCPLLAIALALAGFDHLLVNVESYLGPQTVKLQIDSQPNTVDNIVDTQPVAPPVDLRVPNAHAVSEQPELPIGPYLNPTAATSILHSAPSRPLISRIEEPPQPIPQTKTNAAAIIAILAGAAWLFLSIYLLVRLSLAHLRTVRIRQLSIPATVAEIALCRQIAADFRVRPPAVLRAPFLTSACLVGYWRPAVLLPEADATPLRQALVHELAHLSRHDCLWNMLRQLATALIPIQPLVWLLGRRIEQTAEEVCDDYVVQHGNDRCNYAELLVELASRNVATVPAGVGIISFRSLTARRIARILDASRTLSTRVSHRIVSAILVIAAAATLTTASLRVGAGADEVVEPQDVQQTRNDAHAAGAIKTTGASKNNAVTIRGSGTNREMLLKGRVVDTDGKPAQQFQFIVNLRTGNHSIEPLSPKVEGDSFEVWVPIGGSKWSYLELSASTKDGKKRVFQRVENRSLRQAAIDGVQLNLANANREVEVSVTKSGIAVAGAHVTAELEGNMLLHAETNAEGKAQFRLLKDEKLRQLTAWTNDFQLGGYDFSRKPHHDPLGHAFAVELEKCRDQRIRFLNAEDNAPIAGVPFALIIGNGAPNYNFPGNSQTLPHKMTTNEKGEAVYRWFPDWKQYALEVPVLDPHWAKVGLDARIVADDQGTLLVKLKRRAVRKPLVGKVTSEGLDVGGLLVEIWTFQGEEENRSDRVYAVTNRDGTFSADCLPGSTYCAYVDDVRIVSDIIDLIPYDPDTGNANPVLLHVSEGKPVEIHVTTGPNREPMRNQWVSLRVTHDFTWRENGETRHGGGGMQWGVWTDDKGIARARVLAGAHLTAGAYAGEWRSPQKKVTVKTDGLTTIEFHQEISTAREVTGRLIPPSDLTVDLAHAQIVLGSLDGETDEQIKATTNAEGRFAFKTKAKQFGIFAYTADGKAAGIVTPKETEQPVEVQLAPTADLHGQVLGKDDKPLTGRTVRAEALIIPKERRRDATIATSFLAKTFQAQTDNDGNYTLANLPTQIAMHLQLDPAAGSHGITYLDRFILRPGENRPLMVSRLAETRIELNQPLAEQFKRALRDAALGDYHLMVLIEDATARDFVNANMLDYEKTKEVGAYIHLEIRNSDLADTAAAQFVKSKNWPTPKPHTVFGYALDAAGKELARIELDTTQANAAAKAEDFIRKHVPPPIDANDKWAAAFAEAKRSHRKVWARVSQRFCGPCLLMSRWLDDQHELLSRDYILLKIDNLRDNHGDEVAKRITDNRDHLGVPFYAIFDADQKLVIDSEGPLGNIGHPSGYEGRSHLKKMLLDTRRNLSPAEIDLIVESVKD